MMRLYVSNLPEFTAPERLHREFGAHGEVVNVLLIYDEETGKPTGDAVIEMSSAADDAQQALDGAEWKGQRISVEVI